MGWGLQGFDGECDAFGFRICGEDFDADDLAGFDGFRWFFDEAVGEFADMDEAVLMDAYIYEGAEFSDVGDDAFEDHAGLNVGQFADLLVEAGCDKLFAGVASGFAELFDDVIDGEGAGGELAAVELGEELGVANDLRDGGIDGLGDLLDDRIGLRMYGGGVEGLFAVTNAEESGGLLECFGADAGDLLELGAGAEASVLISEGDDVEGGALSDAGDVAEQGPGRGVEIHADAVDAGLDGGFEGALELALIDVVLVLANADGLGVYLDELGEWVLEAAGDGDSTAHGEVEVRELLAGDVGGRVDAGA